MLQALNTGHDGSLSTGHANSSMDMLARLDYRLDWEDSFMDFLKDLDRHKTRCGLWRPQRGS